jgi:protocatechuate 3,4-dioxygenase beta subunit
MSEFNPSRRDAIKKLAIAGAGSLAAGYVIAYSKVANAQTRTKTPSQPEGPFYPIEDQIDKDTDMTHINGRAESALGQRVRLVGQVLDVTTGTPVVGAVIEFWQACESGKYNHPSDPSDAPLDPNFQYWAQVRTDAKGEFGVLTIRPGAYAADANWTRPPHIHIKIHKPGYPSLTTQIYFGGEQLNEQDQILRRLTKEQRSLVIVDFLQNETSGDLEGRWTAYIARFNRVGSEVTVLSHEATPDLN